MWGFFIMKNTEKIFGFIWVISLLGHLFALPGSPLLLGVGTSFLASFYFYASVPLFLNLSVKNALQFSIYSRVGGKDLVRIIFSGLSLSSLIIGIGIIQLGLDDSGIVFGLCLGEATIVFVLLSLPKAYRDALYYKPAIYRIAILALILTLMNSTG